MFIGVLLVVDSREIQPGSAIHVLDETDVCGSPPKSFSRRAVPRPKAGGWKLAGGGGFTVNHARTAVSGLHISGSNCDLGKLRVLGRQKLRLVTAGGISNWIVGYNDPNRKNPNDLHGVVGQRVKIKEGSRTLSGRLDIIFAVTGNAAENSGDLVISGCDMAFSAKK
jgi:hypothetical protein